MNTWWRLITLLIGIEILNRIKGVWGDRIRSLIIIGIVGAFLLYLLFPTIESVGYLLSNGSNKNNVLAILIVFLAPITLIVLALWIYLLKSFLRLFKKDKCNICSKPTRDVLTEDPEYQKKIGAFCRQHLIEKYSEFFLKSKFKKVVIEFQPSSHTGDVYLYYPVAHLDDFSWEKGGKEAIIKLVQSISGKKCKVCDNDAYVFFIPKEAAPIDKYKGNPSLDFHSKGEYYCNNHALKRIIPSIQNNKKEFSENGGLQIPVGDGYQASFP